MSEFQFCKIFYLENLFVLSLVEVTRSQLFLRTYDHVVNQKLVVEILKNLFSLNSLQALEHELKTSNNKIIGKAIRHATENN